MVYILNNKYFQEAEQERNARIEVDVRAQRLSLQVEELRAKSERGNYKSMNFDEVKRYCSQYVVLVRGETVPFRFVLTLSDGGNCYHAECPSGRIALTS